MKHIAGYSVKGYDFSRVDPPEFKIKPHHFDLSRLDRVLAAYSEVEKFCVSKGFSKTEWTANTYVRVMTKFITQMQPIFNSSAKLNFKKIPKCYTTCQIARATYMFITIIWDSSATLGTISKVQPDKAIEEFHKRHKDYFEGLGTDFFSIPCDVIKKVAKIDPRLVGCIFCMAGNIRKELRKQGLKDHGLY